MKNLVDKIYCINLKKRVDRKSQAEHEFKKHNLDVDFIEAVDGSVEYKKNDPIKMINCVDASAPGLYGVTMSSMKIFKDIINKNLKNALILEDDVEFCEDFINKFKLVFSNTPNDYDILTLGMNERSKPLFVNEYVSRVTAAYCAHAFVITNNHVKRVIKMIEDRYPFLEPMDSFLFSNIANISNVYVSRECLAWQKEGFSDTELRYVNHLCIKNNY